MLTQLSQLLHKAIDVYDEEYMELRGHAIARSIFPTDL